ncbi:zinc metalloprotease HtpX [Caenispirillum salinarum]|uniref:zinc metalloprotease HtpX n=1 Tax=Caenispirillum salinarum TaxID=859058 RepID=UPI00384FEDDC
MGLVLGLVGWLLSGPSGLAVAVIAMAVTIVLVPKVPVDLAMRVIGARPVHPEEAPGLYTILIELSEAAGLKAAPILYRVRGGRILAVAVGDSSRSALALSDGMTVVMDEREMRGVLAHEIAHIAAEDTTLMNLAAALGRVIHTLAVFGLIAAVLIVLLTPEPVIPWVVGLIALAPWAATLLHLALMRRREFAADADAVRLTGDAVGLARALVKLETLPTGGLARLIGGGPGRQRRGLGFLRTHPSTKARIERLVGPISDRVRPMRLH